MSTNTQAIIHSRNSPLLKTRCTVLLMNCHTVHTFAPSLKNLLLHKLCVTVSHINYV